MTQTTLDPIPPLWKRVVESNAVYAGAIRDFLAPENDRVAAVRHGLLAGGIERATALQVLPCLAPDERTQLFPALLFLASSAHGSIGSVRDAILALPREFVLSHVEKEADTYLRDGACDEYRRFLELFRLLDRDMTRRLAERAATHSDADVREAGEDFLEMLAVNQ